MTSIDLNSMTAMNLDGLSTKIAVNDLNVWYGKFHALKHITLAIPEGRVTAFIGPSGCGKSTLLRTFNRMYALYPGQRAEGELMLDGVNILSGTIDDCTLRSRVGMVFQRPTPFPMSIYDNIAYGIRLRENVAKSELDDRVEWALKKAALWNDVKDKLREPGTSLSGGQQQRVAIARALVSKPAIVLADEPTGNLDSKTSADVLGLLKTTSQKFHQTLVMITHNSEIAQLADRIIRIEDGKIVQ